MFILFLYNPVVLVLSLYRGRFGGGGGGGGGGAKGAVLPPSPFLSKLVLGQ